jgi:vault protein inter-alpha-trypsin-like protein
LVSIAGTRNVVGSVRERDSARRTYESAVRAGHGAYLLEHKESRLDTLVAALGCVCTEVWFCLGFIGRCSVQPLQI